MLILGHYFLYIKLDIKNKILITYEIFEVIGVGVYVFEDSCLFGLLFS